MTQTPAADIVERLHSWDHCYPGNINIERAISEAATEIEALRARLEVAPGWSEDADGIACRDDTIALQDKRIEALRAREAELQRKIDEATTTVEYVSFALPVLRMMLDRLDMMGGVAQVDNMQRAVTASLASIRGEG